MGFSLVGRFGQLGNDPFFRVRLEAAQLRALERELRACAKHERRWYTLVATRDNPRRLRLKSESTPDFEAKASRVYLRGEAFRVTGRAGVSCNVAFSSRTALELCGCIERARAGMRKFVEFRVASRRYPLVEFISDADLGAADAARDDDRLARAGAILAARTLEPEDFSDWERLT